MPRDRKTWASAYAKQSQSDFRVYEILVSAPQVEDCHVWHYLQMACEKIAKAYRFRDTETSIEELLTSHIAFSKCIENLLKYPAFKAKYLRQDAMFRQVSRLARRLSREIEKLAPAVDRGTSPENAEYPWAAGEKIVLPCAYSYPNLKLLKEAEGRNFLKLIRSAIMDFDQIMPE